MAATTMASMPEPLLTAEEVAGLLKVSMTTVYDLRRRGELPAVPVGAQWRWNPAIIRAFMAGERPTPAAASVVPFPGRRRRV
jgi:excisionase family DNA binding protein